MLGALPTRPSKAPEWIMGLKTPCAGLPSSGWLNRGLGDIVIHFFSPDQREYYDRKSCVKTAKVLVRLK